MLAAAVPGLPGVPEKAFGLPEGVDDPNADDPNALTPGLDTGVVEPDPDPEPEAAAAPNAPNDVLEPKAEDGFIQLEPKLVLELAGACGWARASNMALRLAFGRRGEVGGESSSRPGTGFLTPNTGESSGEGSRPIGFLELLLTSGFGLSRAAPKPVRPKSFPPFFLFLFIIAIVV